LDREWLEMKGFTFIEVILSLTILSFGLLAITGMFGVSTQALHSSGNRTKAILLAQEKLEELKNLPYHQLISTPMEEDTEEPAHTFQEERGSILLVWSVQKDRPRMGLSVLTVKAAWRSSGGQTQTVSFVTLRTDL
jgi:prepilin-type N-terminal cleavage/methylation domain-containing protein